jgi:predicted ArsR family transcriptional regulator
MDDVEMWTEKTGGRGAPKTMYRLIEAGEEPEQEEAKVIDIDLLRGKAKPAQPPVVSNIFEGLI